MNSVRSPQEVLGLAQRVWADRYATADVIFASGSLLRGEGTPASDLDVVVIYPALPNAFRESFTFEGLPIEAFVHDPETLQYFLVEVDRAAGMSVLAHMIADGIALPAATPFAEDLKKRARAFIDGGPPVLDASRVERLRYVVTDLLDDLAQPRSTPEMLGTATRLFETMTDLYLRHHGHWSGQGKGLVRALQRAEPRLAERLCDAMQAAVATGNPAPLVQVAGDMLDRCGGRLFDGVKADAPAAWRVKRSESSGAP